MPSFELTVDTGMFWNAGEEEEVVKTVLAMKAAKEEVVVEPEDKTELEDMLMSLTGERFSTRCLLVSVYILI